MKKFAIIVVVAILLTACSDDLLASEATLSSAIAPAASQERKIHASEGFASQESFCLPADVAPRMTPHEVETRPPMAEELAAIYMSIPTHSSRYQRTYTANISPVEVESCLKPDTSYSVDEIIEFFEELHERIGDFRKLLERLEARGMPSEPATRAWFKAYDERAFLEGEKAEVRVCEVFFYLPSDDSNEIDYANMYDSYRMYFVKTDGTWRLTTAIWIDEWRGERTETIIVGHEGGKCLWLVESPPHGTGTGYYAHDVVWRNLLTGDIDFTYEMHEFDYSLTDYDGLSALYGAYEQTMPDGEPMTVLADTVYIQTGHLLASFEGYLIDTEHYKADIIQLHQTSVLRFHAGKYPGYNLASYVVDVPMALRDNIVNRYGSSVSDSCDGDARAARFSCDR